VLSVFLWFVSISLILTSESNSVLIVQVADNGMTFSIARYPSTIAWNSCIQCSYTTFSATIGNIYYSQNQQNWWSITPNRDHHVDGNCKCLFLVPTNHEICRNKLFLLSHISLSIFYVVLHCSQGTYQRSIWEITQYIQYAEITLGSVWHILRCLQVIWLPSILRLDEA
jgi:hypothetical protein